MPYSSPLVLATSGDKGPTLASSSHLGSPPGGLLWLTRAALSTWQVRSVGGRVGDHPKSQTCIAV